MEKKIIKGNGANGPGFINYPSLQLSILLSDDSKYIFSTKENLKLDDIVKELNKKISIN